MSLDENLPDLSLLPLYEQATTLLDYQEELKIYDPNHLSSILKIEPGEVWALFAIASYEESEIQELLDLFKGSEYLVKFLVQNPHHIAILRENVDSIDMDKPISSAMEIIERDQPSMTNLVDNLSSEYLSALSKQLKRNQAHKNLWSVASQAANSGITSAQLNWFIDVLSKDYESGSTLFTGGEMAVFTDDVQLIKQFSKHHFKPKNSG